MIARRPPPPAHPPDARYALVDLLPGGFRRPRGGEPGEASGWHAPAGDDDSALPPAPTPGAAYPWSGVDEGNRSALRVVVVECNDHMAEVIARQVEEACAVEAIPWTLGEPAEPPRLPILGTYFHHPEITRRWPDRAGDMHFVPLRVDPDLKSRLEATARAHGSRHVTLVEQDLATAEALAQDVAALLGPDFVVEPAAGDPNALLRSLEGDELLLVAPRVWKSLAAEHRNDPRVFDVCPIIGPAELEGVARWLGRKAAEGS